MKFYWRMAADGVMVLHFLFMGVVIYSVILGWFFDEFYIILMFILTSMTILSQKALDGRCLFTIWEEDLRRKYNPKFSLRRSFTTYYINKIAGTSLTFETTDKFFKKIYLYIYTVSILVLLL